MDTKPESNRTRVHELLEVEPMEWFTIDGLTDVEYMVVQDGTLRERESGDNRINYWRGVGQTMLADMINGKHTIIRRPRITDEQRRVMEFFLAVGYKHVTKDEDGYIRAYEHLPELRGDRWAYIVGTGYMVGSSVDGLSDLIPDWTQPLDIEKTLKETQP